MNADITDKFCTAASACSNGPESSITLSEDCNDDQTLNLTIYMSSSDTKYDGRKKKETRFKDNDKVSQHPCPNLHCTKVFTSTTYLQKHRIKCKAPELVRHAPFNCSFCKQVLSSFRALEEHTRIHTDEKPYRCSDCGMSFRHFNSFIKHQDTHTDERPYTCEICGKNFKQKQYLKSHMLCHTKERKFKCSKCSKSYRSRSDLNRHEIIHSDVRPYKCTKCDMAFSDISTSKRHIRRHEIKEQKQKQKASTVLLPCQLCSHKSAQLAQVMEHLLSDHGDIVTEVTMLDDGVLRYVYKEEEQLFITFQSAQLPQGNKVKKTRLTHIGPAETVQGIPLVSGESVVITEPATSQSQDEFLEVPPSVIVLTESAPSSADRSELSHAQHMESFVAEYSTEATVSCESVQEMDVTVSEESPALEGNASDCSYNCKVGGDDSDSKTYHTTLEESHTTSNQELTVNIIPDKCAVQIEKAVEVITVANQSDEANLCQMVTNDTQEVELHLKTQLDARRSNAKQADDANKSDTLAVLKHTHSTVSTGSSTEIIPGLDASTVVIGAQHPSQAEIAQRIQQSFDSDYLTGPDFSSQEFYNWLSEFTNLCQLLAMPLSTAVFDKIINLEKLITAKLASPTAFIKQKTNYKSLMIIAKYLKDVLTSHLNHVMATLDND